MDRDVFSKVSRLGRDAGDTVCRALAGEDLHPYLLAKVVDTVIRLGGGFAAWPLVKHALDELRDAPPLFAGANRMRAVEAIEDACRSAGRDLDNVLRQVAVAAALRGEPDPQAVMSRCISVLLDRAVMSGRGGCFERISAAQRPAAWKLVQPIADRAARVFVERPEAKQTALAREFKPMIRPHDNLLGETQ